MNFLKTAAEYIFKKHPLRDLSGLCVVLPTRRATFFFKRELAQLSDTPFLAPDVLAVDDFVMQLCGLQQIDNIGLLFELYDVFKDLDPNVKFDRFTPWASTLLQDFDKIDQYLAPPKAVFSWVSAAKAIERWQPGEGWIAQPDSATEKYFKLFENLTPVYTSLQDRLLARRMAYRGMAYRYLAENTFELLLAEPKHTFYYFAGFNALSASEEEIIAKLIKAKRAETLWDTDTYYMETNRHFEAGNLLRRYKNDIRFGSERDWKWQFDNLQASEKNIQIIGVPNISMQAKVAGHIYQQWQMSKGEGTEGKGQDGEDDKKVPLVGEVEAEGRGERGFVQGKGDEKVTNLTAIVLGDENLLMPVMYSLDESVTDFNVTMGVSLKNSMLFTLIDAIFELQRNMVEFRSKSGETLRIPKFNHRHIEKVLNHPFIRRYELIYYESSFTPKNEVNQSNSSSTNPIRATLKAISKEGKVFLSDQEIKDLGGGEPLFEVLFTRWNNDPRKAVSQFYELINRLRVVYRENKDAIETEYLYLFYTLLKRLEVIVNERKEIVTLKTFRNFLYELIRQTKIPFSGEPIADLQIMGMLETRCLDFERVIIMSVNEGILPSGKKQNSLIPFEACVEFGLPTHSDQDTVMSYHFFRLLQRASEIVLIHTQPAGEGQKNEKSRFLLQIEHELAKTNKHIKLSKPSVKFKSETNEQIEEVELVIAKNESIQDFLRKDLSEKGIYATHINQFITCSLQYYFKRVAGIAEEEDVEETLGADGFGNWIHATLERIDIEYASQTHLLTSDNISQIIKELSERLQADFVEKFPGQILDEGSNFLLYQIAQNLLKSFFENQLSTEGLLPMEVLGTEKMIKQAVELQANGQVVTALIAGKIDRIERLDRNLLRVVDYKTGKVEQKDLTIKSENIEENLLTNADNKKWDKVRQLWLYKYLVLKKMLGTDGLLLGGQRLRADENKVVAGIYSFRNIAEGFLTNNMEFEQGESAEHFIAQSEAYLSQFVSRLLDPTEPFRRTDDLEKCQYCDYRGICGR